MSKYHKIIAKVNLYKELKNIYKKYILEIFEGIGSSWSAIEDWEKKI